MRAEVFLTASVVHYLQQNILNGKYSPDPGLIKYHRPASVPPNTGQLLKCYGKSETTAWTSGWPVKCRNELTQVQIKTTILFKYKLLPLVSINLQWRFCKLESPFLPIWSLKRFKSLWGAFNITPIIELWQATQQYAGTFYGGPGSARAKKVATTDSCPREDHFQIARYQTDKTAGADPCRTPAAYTKSPTGQWKTYNYH